ncbi:MAG: flagellar protein FlgN [Zoogloeaceae bacterium]|jgi:flagella synthesis protein FlgN|nr:flagellar protein FlgN [Zoogloeaceae bacterium]
MPTTTSLAQILAAEIVAVQRFVALLNEEKTVLSSASLEGLARVVAEKGRLAEELESIGRQRQDCLERLGIAEDGKTVECRLAEAPDTRMLEDWKKLQQLAREARELNELNGRCIALLARNNKELLDTLAGRDAFYGPDGQTAGKSGLRIIDSV